MIGFPVILRQAQKNGKTLLSRVDNAFLPTFYLNVGRQKNLPSQRTQERHQRYSHAERGNNIYFLTYNNNHFTHIIGFIIIATRSNLHSTDLLGYRGSRFKLQSNCAGCIGSNRTQITCQLRSTTGTRSLTNNA